MVLSLGMLLAAACASAPEMRADNRVPVYEFAPRTMPAGSPYAPPASSSPRAGVAPRSAPAWQQAVPAAAAGWVREGTPTPSPPPAATTSEGPVYYQSVATYYGWDFQGQPMAAGPAFDLADPALTASNYWPLGTRLRVWRVAGGPWDASLTDEERAYYFGHSILVVVMDRGFFAHALDLSLGAFALLGRPSEGVIAVMIQPLGGAPPQWQLP
jgi:rare lipoprotein A (peptidoglycan hydrolase)